MGLRVTCRAEYMAGLTADLKTCFPQCVYPCCAVLQCLDSGPCAGLYAWRDRIARKEDESSGYVLSRNLMQKLAIKMPTSASLVKSFCSAR